MSLDRSLKGANALIRHRNVLTRAERLDRLTEQEKWNADKSSVLGMPKVANRKMAIAKAEKTEAAEGDAAATAVAPAGAKGAPAKGAAPAAAGKAAPAAKGAAPAAKGAAPAAKPAAKKK